MNPTTLAGNGFSWVLQSSWQAAVLVLLVLIVQMIFRRKLSPAWRYGLWLLVVVRLLMPASPQSAISIFNLAKFAPPQPIAASPPAPAMGAPEAPVSDLQPQRQPHDDRAFHASPAWTEAHPPATRRWPLARGSLDEDRPHQSFDKLVRDGMCGLVRRRLPSRLAAGMGQCPFRFTPRAACANCRRHHPPHRGAMCRHHGDQAAGERDRDRGGG